mgnify:CR=1 FL=1
MKNKLLILAIFLLPSCSELNLRPLSEGSSENWLNNQAEVEMSLNKLFDINYWYSSLLPISTSRTTNAGELQYWDRSTDDWNQRESTTEITSSTINGQTAFVNILWDLSYECIASANRLINGLKTNIDGVSSQKLLIYDANARFVRASQYAKLIFLWGDVPYYDTTISIEQAFGLKRESKDVILKKIYADYDYAIEYLPNMYANNEKTYATKGAALALKARIAVYMGDYPVAISAAKKCMELGIYQLEPTYGQLFLSSTRSSKEVVFSNPRLVSQDIKMPKTRVAEPLPRLVGGFGNGGPSLDLFYSYLCTDGLPVDKSPLFNPMEPFKNRDPRCTASIVEFGTPWLGYIYQPHPDSLNTLNTQTGVYVKNQDSRGYLQWAAFNGLVWKKGIDEDWLDLQTDPLNIVIRYADVLMIYAEAKIEQNDIDQSVLDALNMVRSRAYKVNYTESTAYPAITSRNQAELRKVLRIERRMEFAFEGLRYADLIRWRIAAAALDKKPIYAMLDVPDLRERIVNKGLWFIPQTPTIDENGIPDFSNLYRDGYIRYLAIRSFDSTRQYLWPLPTTEVNINNNIKQNPGY